jgi:UDP-2,3-diacylglucosamine pyrophosphatase LpxH
MVGDRLHTTVLHLNRWLNALRARLGFPYWSLAKYVKLKIKNAVSYIVDFECAIAAEARRRGANGVVCGHIHKAEIRDIDGILYCNDGDWVESLTALVEGDDGSLRVLSWHDVAARAADIISSGTREELTLAYIAGN